MEENKQTQKTKIKLSSIFAVIALLSLIIVFILGINLGKSIESYTYAKESFEKIEFEKGSIAYLLIKELIGAQKRQISLAIFNMIIPILLTLTAFFLAISNIDHKDFSRATSSVDEHAESALIPCNKESLSAKIDASSASADDSYQGNRTPPVPKATPCSTGSKIARVKLISIPQDKTEQQHK